MNGITMIQRKETRGKLVATLYAQFGRWTQVSSLINAFARGLPAADTEVPNQLNYLADEQKGFVAIRYQGGEPELTPMREAYVQLTATGVNLYEGDIDDPGIIFGDGQRA
ncbi:MAG: hypothetical protein RSJ41_02530 [Clostridia bacterium]